MHSYSSLDLVVVKLCLTLWSPRECPCELHVAADSAVLMSPKLKVFVEGSTLSERYMWQWSDDSVCSLVPSHSPYMSLAIDSKSAFPAPA